MSGNGSNAAEAARIGNAIRVFASAATIAFVQGVVELNNTGGEGVPAAPLDTGELRGSPRVTIGSPSEESSSEPFTLLSPSDVSKAFQLGGFEIGDTCWISWVARHANILEGGRRLGSHGRMLGSEQAPEGWVWLGIEAQMSAMDRWEYPGARP